MGVDGGKVIVADTADKNRDREFPITTTTVLALGFNPTASGSGCSAATRSCASGTSATTATR